MAQEQVQKQVQKQVKDMPPAMLAPMLVLWSSHHLAHRSRWCCCRPRKVDEDVTVALLEAIQRRR